jgi:hypothetical protein
VSDGAREEGVLIAYFEDVFVCLVFNANNISVISWWSVLLVGETGGPASFQSMSH